MDKTDLAPFFIVGCARSGTTLLRDVLRLHPNLNAPEETSFYRWGDPFATDGFRHVYLNNPTLKRHYEIDGLSANEVKKMLAESHSRRHFNVRYASTFLARADGGQRWFDKTPQNIYGLLLIRAQFPESKIIFIHRHPYEVITSLKRGKVMPKQSLVAAVNYWVEAMQIIDVYKRLPQSNLIELRYDDLCQDPHKTIAWLLEQVQEDSKLFDFSKVATQEDKNLEYQENTIFISKRKNELQTELEEEELEYIWKHCQGFMEIYNYDDLRELAGQV